MDVLNKLLPNVENLTFEMLNEKHLLNFRDLSSEKNREFEINHETLTTENLLLKAIMAKVGRQIKKINIVLNFEMYS